jgi:hypothetical protein
VPRRLYALHLHAPGLGRYFDPADPIAKSYLDFLIACDESSVRDVILRPLELSGVYRPKR